MKRAKPKEPRVDEFMYRAARCVASAARDFGAHFAVSWRRSRIEVWPCNCGHPGCISLTANGEYYPYRIRGPAALLEAFMDALDRLEKHEKKAAEAPLTNTVQ